MFCELPEPAFALVMEAPVEAEFEVRVVEPDPGAVTVTTPGAPVPP